MQSDMTMPNAIANAEGRIRFSIFDFLVSII